MINCGCMYQHQPLKYAKLRRKGENWVPWPLSTTPASFHKFKNADELRAFFGCALYDAAGHPRPAPRSLFVPLGPSPEADEKGLAACADGGPSMGRAAAAPSLQQQQQALHVQGQRARVRDGGLVQIGSSH